MKQRHSPPWTGTSLNVSLLHILLMLLIVQTVFPILTTAILIKCTNIDEFLYASPETHCSSYYRCTAREQYVADTCEVGTMFDFYKQSCTRSASICYESICTGRTNGIYQDTTHACRRFYTCHAGRVTSIDNCPPKQLHNGRQCVDEELVSCNSPETTAIGYAFAGDQRCKDKADGYYAEQDNCSTTYLACVGGEVNEVQNCPNGFHFNKEQQLCVPGNCDIAVLVTEEEADNVNKREAETVAACESQIEALITFEPNVERESEKETKREAGLDTDIAQVDGEYDGDDDDVICRNKRNGANIDPASQDCATYAMCKDGQLVAHERCSQQAVFNGESCVPSPLYACPRAAASQNAPIVDLCHKKPNGLYASPQHGCSAYVRCHNARVIAINDCPSGEYFDASQTRRCIYEKFFERRRCYDRGISLDCDAKANGYYREPDCASYYHCYAGRKTEYKCAADHVFNGQRCVARTQYACPTAGGDVSCMGRPDGYFRDAHDGCRSYHYCSGGHRITYLCEAGHTFDSRTMQCVRQQLTVSGFTSGGLRCRTNDFTCYGKSDGYHADYRSNCRNYVYCKQYERITQLTCRANNVFNGQRCVPPNEYACPSLYNHRQLNCMPKHCVHSCRRDGFFPDLNADCRDYYFCIGGKASKLSCPLGKRFNGEICVAADKFSCPVFCSSNSNNNDAGSSCPLGGYVA